MLNVRNSNMKKKNYSTKSFFLKKKIIYHINLVRNWNDLEVGSNLFSFK